MASSRERRRRGATCAAAAALALAAAAHAAAGRIAVPADVVVGVDPVRLRDVAMLEGEGAVALADVVLVPAPHAGESRTLDGARLLDLLRRAGLDPAVTYTLPPTLRLRRATQEVTEDAVRGLVESWLAAQLGAGSADAQVERLEMPGTILVPAGTWTGTVTAPPGVDPVGRVRLEVEILVDGLPARTVWVTAQIARYGDVVVTTRQVARGEVVTAADVDVQRLELSRLPRTVLTDPTDAAGAVARQTLRPYAPLHREQLGTPVLVRRGDAVLLVARRGGLRLSVPGEVRHDAARGETVAVVNRASGKALVGRVLDAGTVGVEF